MKNFFDFFSHDTDPEHLEEILQSQYGITFEGVDTLRNNAPIPDICDLASKMCNGAITKIAKFSGAGAVTDQRFFAELKLEDDPVFQKPDSHNREFLAIDALFHIRKRSIQENCEKDFHSSFSQFYIDIEAKFKNNKDIKIAEDDNNLSKSMLDVFMPSIYSELWGIHGKQNNTNYKLPKFMDHFLLLLLETIKNNPYSGRQRELLEDEKRKSNEEKLASAEKFYKNSCLRLSDEQIAVCMEKQRQIVKDTPMTYSEDILRKFYGRLQTFFINQDFYQRLYDLYHRKMHDEEDGKEYKAHIEDRWIAMYLADRLFDLDTIAYLVQKLSSVTSNMLDIDHAILPALIPIFFVPNIFDKKVYCDMIVNVLSYDHKVQTQFLGLSVPPGMLKQMNQNLEDDLADIHSHNLRVCKQYLYFLSALYFPVLSACFYVLLHKVYANPQRIQEKLVEFLEQSNCDQLFEQKIQDWLDTAKESPESIRDGKREILESEKKKSQKLTPLERKRFANIYAHIQDQLCTSEKREAWKSTLDLDYLVREDYRIGIQKTIAKYKLGIEKPIVKNTMATGISIVSFPESGKGNI